MQDFTALLFVISIGMNMMCALFIGFSKLQNHGPQFKAVLSCCLLVVFFQFSNWQYHLASELSEAIFWLKLQTSFVLLAIIPVGFIYSLWCDIKHIKKYYWSFGLLSTLLIIVNLAQPYGMRLDPNFVPEVIAFEGFSKETIYRVSGSPSTWITVYIA